MKPWILVLSGTLLFSAVLLTVSLRMMTVAKKGRNIALEGVLTRVYGMVVSGNALSTNATCNGLINEEVARVLKDPYIKSAVLENVAGTVVFLRALDGKSDVSSEDLILVVKAKGGQFVGLNRRGDVVAVTEEAFDGWTHEWCDLAE